MADIIDDDIDPDEIPEDVVDEKYQDIRKTAVAPRNVNVPNDGSGRNKSYTAAQEETNKLTDMQATFRHLLPNYSITEINDIAQAIMMARIFPQNFRPLFRKIVVMVMRANPDLDPELVQIQVNSAMTIGYDGRCRVEFVEVAGVLGDEEGLAMGNSMMR